MKIVKILFTVSALSFFSACDTGNPALNQMIAQVQNFLGFPQSGRVPKEVKDEVNLVGTPAPKQTAGQLAKENSELLAEMFNVVFDQKDSETKTDFGSLAMSLNQGASLEGIYRGLVAGSRYRALESKSQGASPTELKAFAIEMSELQDTMKNPSTFDSDAKSAPTIQYPTENDANTPVAHDGSQEVTTKKDKTEVRNELLETFLGASGYTLKRVLGNEALKKMDEMKDDRGEMAKWYADFVIRMAQSKVDFGLPLRSQPDYDFHFKFAQKMAVDRTKWEVLNRYHRYLNFTATQ
jgi:flagellar basal body-associated protein FliL